MSKYNHQKIERKWQKKWIEEGVHRANENSSKPKYYQLETFPYPSAAGLHVGHPKGYIAEDIHARFMRMKGYEVLYTMGWDAFGLPTENYAIKVNKSPQAVAKNSINNFKRQVQMFGLSYDWEREINTSSPDYYRWTQWLFIQLFKKGLAYRAKAKVNWCPKDQTVLANEQVANGKCERCGSAVEQREMEQWFLAITKYADQLLEDLKGLDWPEATIKRQQDWIGRSEGALISFPVIANRVRLGEAISKEDREIATSSRRGGIPRNDDEMIIKVFTTRPDTLFGATYLVLAPEHQLLLNNELGIKNYEEVEKYIKESKNKTERERQESKDKTGVELKGIKAINPATKEEVSLWVADYVLSGYGTGAIMAVPAHDERDFEFAKKYSLPIINVIYPKNLNCIILHGCPSNAENDPTKRTYDKHWIPWIKKELLRKGIAVETPLMPTPWLPDYISWKKEFEKNNINEHTILIGHSCGTAFLVRWLGESKVKIKKLILVAPWKMTRDGSNDAKKSFYEYHINPSIKDRVDNIVIFTADDEEEIGKKSAKIYYDALGGKIIELKSRGHYVISDMGTDNFPELLEEVLKMENYVGEGYLVNSGQFNGMDSEKAKWEITKFVGGERKVQYKLRDWSVSRQRYWGTPIPMIHCEKCALRDPSGQGIFPVSDEDLPVLLPKNVDYRPKGKPPLASSEKFINTKCPQCGGKAKRDPETLDTFVDSSWYYLRYTDPRNNEKPFDKLRASYWLPVDLYVIGAEHTVLHLLYSRFITKFLRDEGYLNFQEPFLKIRHVGLILGADGQKMSKSKGNVVNPDELVEKFSADASRLYKMFMGPFEDSQPWDPRGVIGSKRLLDKIWNFFEERPRSKKESADLKINQLMHQTIKKVGEDIEKIHFNTAISSLMILSGQLFAQEEVSESDWEKFLKILFPFAPHFAQELWEKLGRETLLDYENWPAYDEKLIEEEEFELVVQVNGKLRGAITARKGISQSSAEELAKKITAVQNHLSNKKIKKAIFVKDRLINFILDS